MHLAGQIRLEGARCRRSELGRLSSRLPRFASVGREGDSSGTDDAAAKRRRGAVPLVAIVDSTITPHPCRKAGGRTSAPSKAQAVVTYFSAHSCTSGGSQSTGVVAHTTVDLHSETSAAFASPHLSIKPAFHAHAPARLVKDALRRRSHSTHLALLPASARSQPPARHPALAAPRQSLHPFAFPDRFHTRSHWSTCKHAGPVGRCRFEGFRESGRRGSNPRPSAWEADALPTELRPRSFTIAQALGLESGGASGIRRRRSGTASRTSGAPRCV